MPVGYMVCGGTAGLCAGAAALMAGMGGLWAAIAYMLIGSITIGLITLRV